MRYGPGQSAGRIKPAPQPKQVRIHPVKVRSSALAQREGGIGARPHPQPHEHLTPAQRQRIHSLVAEYMGQQNASASAGNIGKALGAVGHAYTTNPVARAPIVGRHGGLLSVVEDLVKSTDPISIGQTLAAEARHPSKLNPYHPGHRGADRSLTPEQALKQKGLSYGVVGKFGPERPKGIDVERAAIGKDVKATIASKKTIAAKPGETRIVERPATVGEARARLGFLNRQLEGFYKRAEKLSGHEAGIPQEGQGPLFGGRARGRSVEGRVTGAPVTRSSAAEVRRAATVENLNRIAKRNPNHPLVKQWRAAEAERAQLMESLHGQMPGEPHGPLPNIAEIARTPEAAVRRNLGGMRMGNREVEALRKPERAARLARGEAAREQAGGGLLGHIAFLHEQRGKMPDLPFEKLTDLSAGDLDHLIRIVDSNEHLLPWQKNSARQALNKLLVEGKRPQKRQVEHLTTVFGPEKTANLIHATLGQKAIGLLGIPRSVMASFDVSAPMRQNLMGMAISPGIGLRNFGPMYKSFAREGHYAGDLANIHEHADYPLAMQSGLPLSELAAKPGKREEPFPSQMAEQIPGVGHVVRASGRAYTGYLDNVRFQMFVHFINILRKKGIDPESYPELKGLSKIVRGGREYPNTYAEGIAKLIASATGRGYIKGVESWGPAMNVMFFSPRLMYSRINFLDPSWYFRLDPFARRQALKGVARLTTTAGGTFALAAYLGAQIGTDPRSADFAKIRLGNTRVDILGGFQQYIRLMAQLYSGQIISSTTGKTMQLGGGYGQQNRLSILARFAQGKLSPPASLVTDFFRGTTFAGQPFKIKYELLSRLTPLVAQDALDLYRSSGSAPLTALAYLVSAHGVGLQTYKAPKQKVKGPGGSNAFLPAAPSGSSNPYLQSGGGGSSNPFMP